MRQQSVKLLPLVIVSLALTISAADKAGWAKAIQEFEKKQAEINAKIEQRKAAVNDLIDTYNKCQGPLNQLERTKIDSPERKSAGQQVSQCAQTLWAKIDKTPLDVLTPFPSAAKGDDLLELKISAFFRLYEAYEYGTEHPNSAATNRKPRLPRH